MMFRPPLGCWLLVVGSAAAFEGLFEKQAWHAAAAKEKLDLHDLNFSLPDSDGEGGARAAGCGAGDGFFSSETDSDNELSALDVSGGLDGLRASAGAIESEDATNSEGIGVAATVSVYSASVACAFVRALFRSRSLCLMMFFHLVLVILHVLIPCLVVCLHLVGSLVVVQLVECCVGRQEVNSGCTHQGVQDSHFAIHGHMELDRPVYHGDSCARMHAQSNSRLECGHNRAGETKTPSMCTRFGCRCPVGKKLASPQQEPGEVHVETWAGRDESLNLNSNRGVLSQCSFLEFLFSLLCYLERKGQGYGGSRVPEGRRRFSLPFLQRGLGNERIVPHSVGGPLTFVVFLLVFIWARPPWGHKPGSGAGHCLLGCGGLSHP